MPRRVLEEAIAAESVAEREEIFSRAIAAYDDMQTRWIAARTPEALRLPAREILKGAREFDRLVELDRETYRASLSAETAMLRL